MPTTLTGLLLFVVLLLPGFAYLVGKERAGTERRSSPFRETVAIVAASVAAELVVLTITAPIWTRHLDITRLVRDPDQYWKCAPGPLAAWAVAILLGATGLAYVTTWPVVRALPARLLPQRLQDKFTYPHPSSVSGWWLLFEYYEKDRPKHVGLVLDDGSFVSGTRLSFNNDASDSPDRDIILVAPLLYRPSGADEAKPYPASTVSVSARRIVTMFVSPVESTDPLPVEEEVVVPQATQASRVKLLLDWGRRRRRRSRQNGND